MGDAVQTPGPAPVRQLAHRGHNLDVRAVVAAQGDQSARAIRAGQPQRGRAARITLHDEAPLLPQGRELGIGGVGLDGHHPGAAIQQRPGEQGSLASQPGDDHVVSHERQPEPADLRLHHRRQRAEHGIGRHGGGGEAGHLELPGERPRDRAAFEHEQLEGQVQPCGDRIERARLALVPGEPDEAGDRDDGERDAHPDPGEATAPGPPCRPASATPERPQPPQSLTPGSDVHLRHTSRPGTRSDPFCPR